MGTLEYQYFLALSIILAYTVILRENNIQKSIS